MITDITKIQSTGSADRPPLDQPPFRLDAAALANLSQLDPGGSSGLLHRILLTYASSLARLRQQMVQGLAHGDMASLRLATHTLKSSSASVGALALSECCAHTELAVREGRLEALPLLIHRLLAEADRVDIAVRQLLSDCA